LGKDLRIEAEKASCFLRKRRRRRNKMKKQIAQTDSLAMHTFRFVMTGLFVAFMTAVPFGSAMAQSSQEPVAAESFAALSGTALTLTNSTVLGSVGVDVGGAVTLTASSVVGTVHEGDILAIDAYGDFLDAYEAIGSESYPCTGSLNVAYTDAALTLTPGVYCSTAAVTFTRTTITLDALGDENAVWIFKIGTGGTGALTGTGLSVVMANNAQPCNVYWWVAQAATLTTSNTKGSILAGAAVTVTGGSLIGQILAEAGVTMTGADVVSCNSLNILIDPPVVDEETCEEFCANNCEEFCPNPKPDKDCKHDKDCKGPKHSKDCKSHKDCNDPKHSKDCKSHKDCNDPKHSKDCKKGHKK
jgi:hypothetical protein